MRLTLLLAGVLVAGAMAPSGSDLASPPRRPRAPPRRRHGCVHMAEGRATRGVVFLANPGEAEVLARVTGVGAEGPRATEEVTVPAGGQREVTVPARARADSTFVETFGG